MSNTTPSAPQFLDLGQMARLEALQAASRFGRRTGGPFGPITPPDVIDMVDLAEYIFSGLHPLDRNTVQVEDTSIPGEEVPGVVVDA